MTKTEMTQFDGCNALSAITQYLTLVRIRSNPSRRCIFRYSEQLGQANSAIIPTGPPLGAIMCEREHVKFGFLQISTRVICCVFDLVPSFPDLIESQHDIRDSILLSAPTIPDLFKNQHDSCGRQ